MIKLLGVLILLVSTSGCFFEGHGGRHRGHGAVVSRGHRHCVGCGHVQIRGAWVIQD